VCVRLSASISRRVIAPRNRVQKLLPEQGCKYYLKTCFSIVTFIFVFKKVVLSIAIGCTTFNPMAAVFVLAAITEGYGNDGDLTPGHKAGRLIVVQDRFVLGEEPRNVLT
jgi:hypothetical protein